MSQYLSDHETMSDSDKQREIKEFTTACRLLVEAVGKDALKRNRVINAARADSVLAGLTLAIRNNPTYSTKQVVKALQNLEKDPGYVENTQKSTSHRSSVQGRLDSAVRYFAE